MTWALRGAIFESWVASELFKQQLHAGLHGSLLHLRADRGIEIDLLLETGTRMLGIEVKSGATVVPDHTRNLRRFAELASEQGLADELAAYLIYGGDQRLRLSVF
jgi:uncharacterized protein